MREIKLQRFEDSATYKKLMKSSKQTEISYEPIAKIISSIVSNTTFSVLPKMENAINQPFWHITMPKIIDKHSMLSKNVNLEIFNGLGINTSGKGIKPSEKLIKLYKISNLICQTICEYFDEVLTNANTARTHHHFAKETGSSVFIEKGKAPKSAFEADRKIMDEGLKKILEFTMSIQAFETNAGDNQIFEVVDDRMSFERSSFHDGVVITFDKTPTFVNEHSNTPSNTNEK